MGKVDDNLYRAKYANDPVKYFKHLLDVESVEVLHDEIRVKYRHSNWVMKLGDGVD